VVNAPVLRPKKMCCLKRKSKREGIHILNSSISNTGWIVEAVRTSIYVRQIQQPRTARRAGLVCHHDGGAASLSDPFAAMVGSPAVIARGESGEEKCRRPQILRDGRHRGKIAGNRREVAASGVFCPQHPDRQLPVVGPGCCEEAVEVSGGPKRRVETLRNLSNNNLAHHNKSSTPAFPAVFHSTHHKLL
jgi:hypothetical protein